MGKKQWTTTEQQAWLEVLVPAFIEAQQEKATGAFFKTTYDEWHAKWPPQAPTKDKIKDAEGSTNKALAGKQKTIENRVKFWFHNHTRGSSSGAGTWGVLKLGPSSKNVQPWQVYLNKYQNTKLKEKINKAWHEHLSEVPEGGKPEKTLFEIRNKLAQQLYAAETAEVKQEVEEHRKKNEARHGDDRHSQKEQVFPKAATESIAKQAGWNVLLIVGGPNPRLGGKITMLALHQGTTMDGKTFENFMGHERFEKKVMSNFDKFLHESFDQEECNAQALSNENTPEYKSMIKFSDSEDDQCTPKSLPSLSISQKEFRQEKAKRIARNRKLLLEMSDGIRDAEPMSHCDVCTKTAMKLADTGEPASNTKATQEDPTPASPHDVVASRLADIRRLSSLSNALDCMTPASSHDVVAPSAGIHCSSSLSNALDCMTPASSHDVVASSAGIRRSSSLSNALDCTTPAPSHDVVAPSANIRHSSSPSNALDCLAPVPSHDVVAPSANIHHSSSPSNALDHPAPAPSHDAVAPSANIRHLSSPSNALDRPAPAPSHDVIARSAGIRRSSSPSNAPDCPAPGSSCEVAVLLADSFYANAWFASWLAHFRRVSPDVSWQALVMKWAQYEVLNPPDGRLPTASRLEEVQWWIKCKRLVGTVPYIKKPSEFGAMWKLWWVKMQPAWRGGELLVKTMPTDADWEPILRGGSNGLSIVVMTLSWWVHAMGLNNQLDSALLVAINNMTWVFSELVTMLSTASIDMGRKHPREEAETAEEGLTMKKARTGS